MSKFKIEPKDILNYKGLNLLTITGVIPIFSEGDIVIQGTLTKVNEDDAENENVTGGRPFHGDGKNIPVSVTINKSDIKDQSEEAILAEVLKQLDLKLASQK